MSIFPNYSIDSLTVSAFVKKLDIPPLLIWGVIEQIIWLSRWQISYTADDINNRLEKEKRWRGMSMNFPDNVALHSERVKKMAEVSSSLLSSLYTDFDLEYFVFLAKFHDLPEAISPVWDIPSPFKIKFNANDLVTATKVDIIAIERLLLTYPFPPLKNGSDSRRALYDSLTKGSLEMQVVSYLDKLDWFFTCIQEVLSGNSKKYKQKRLWTKSFLDKALWYIDVLKEIKAGKKLSLLQTAFVQISQDDKSFFNIWALVNIENSLKIWTEDHNRLMEIPSYWLWIRSIWNH